MDNNLINNKTEDNNFYGSIVKNLKQEAQKLNKLLETCRNNYDMNIYIATLKSLRETLDLVHKYDWQLMYSEYKTNDVKQIAVWEQNHEGEIRNHKTWDVSPTLSTGEVLNSIAKDWNGLSKSQQDFISKQIACLKNDR